MPNGMIDPDRDYFLSEEDLDLSNLSESELFAYWASWLRQAQVTNAEDEHLISHGVFSVEPGAARSLPLKGYR